MTCVFKMLSSFKIRVCARSTGHYFFPIKSLKSKERRVKRTQLRRFWEVRESRKTRSIWSEILNYKKHSVIYPQASELQPTCSGSSKSRARARACRCSSGTCSHKPARNHRPKPRENRLSSRHASENVQNSNSSEWRSGARSYTTHSRLVNKKDSELLNLASILFNYKIPPFRTRKFLFF